MFKGEQAEFRIIQQIWLEAWTDLILYALGLGLPICKRGAGGIWAVKGGRGSESAGPW